MSTYSLHHHHGAGNLAEQVRSWLHDRSAAWRLQHERLVEMNVGSAVVAPRLRPFHARPFRPSFDADARRVADELQFRAQQD